MQRMQAGLEFGLQRVVDRPVLRQPGEPSKGVGPDFHSIMRLTPRCCASMTVVEM